MSPILWNVRLIKVKYLGFFWTLWFLVFHGFPISFSCLPSQPCGLEMTFFEKASRDPYALNKLSWWTSEENTRYQATRNEILHQRHGVCSDVLRGLAPLSTRCAVLWGGWLTSSLLPGSRQTLEAYKGNTNSTDWPHYRCGWLGYLTDSVPQNQVLAFKRSSKSGSAFTYVHQWFCLGF